VPLWFRASVVTDTGPVREINEDAAYASPRLLVLADGVGGAAHGEVASATTELVLRRLERRDGDVQVLLAAAVAEARDVLEVAARTASGFDTMATTLVAVLTDGQEVGLAHVGDSRAYLLGSGGLRRLTRDHTWVQELVDAGSITPEQARTHPRRSVVTRALDGHQRARPDLSTVDTGPGDRLLVCSDGVSDYLDDEAITEVLAHGAGDAAARTLVERALVAGSRDNVTAIVADVDDGPVDAAVTAHRVGAAVDPRDDPAWTRD
jgi:PPM family protein phosphatase